MGMKQAYREKMDARLREWQAKIDELKARADRADAVLPHRLRNGERVTAA